MSNINDASIVKKQYASANNLSTRISIHDRYSTNKMGFGNWIFSNYKIDEGMVETARGTIVEYDNVEYNVIDIQEIPYENKRQTNAASYRWSFDCAKGIWDVYSIIESKQRARLAGSLLISLILNNLLPWPIPKIYTRYWASKSFSGIGRPK